MPISKDKIEDIVNLTLQEIANNLKKFPNDGPLPNQHQLAVAINLPITAGFQKLHQASVAEANKDNGLSNDKKHEMIKNAKIAFHRQMRLNTHPDKIKCLTKRTGGNEFKHQITALANRYTVEEQRTEILNRAFLALDANQDIPALIFSNHKKENYERLLEQLLWSRLMSVIEEYQRYYFPFNQLVYLLQAMINVVLISAFVASYFLVFYIIDNFWILLESDTLIPFLIGNDHYTEALIEGISKAELASYYRQKYIYDYDLSEKDDNDVIIFAAKEQCSLPESPDLQFALMIVVNDYKNFIFGWQHAKILTQSLIKSMYKPPIPGGVFWGSLDIIFKILRALCFIPFLMLDSTGQIARMLFRAYTTAVYLTLFTIKLGLTLFLNAPLYFYDAWIKQPNDDTAAKNNQDDNTDPNPLFASR